MRGTSIGIVVASAMILTTGCGAGDTRIDPGDLELRDLLGVAPDVANRWDAEQRASARRVLREALPATETTSSSTVELWISDQWDEHKLGYLPGRGLELLSALALDAGHTRGPLVISPAPRLGMIASYETVEARTPKLIVNPVVLAALEPDGVEAIDMTAAVQHVPGDPSAARIQPSKQTTMSAPVDEVATAGNPYSFYGSVAECAFAQRTRCESCLASSNCAPVTSANDGNVECTTLGENNGRGYFLLCINLALSITSVDRCTGEAAPSCSTDTVSANDLGRLEVNAAFLDDATCGGGLDSCLAEIYGAPQDEFPGSTDGGITPPARPPRDTSVDCGDSCSSNNNNCEASPSCNCEGPSCNNSFSCDSACSSSNGQSGCGDNCASCSEDDGTTSSGGGSCGGDDGSSSSGGGCGGDTSGGSSGGSCGSSGGSSGGSCGGDSCSGGSCGGDSCSGGDCSGCSGGSSGSSSCNVSRRSTSAGGALAISLMWAFMPVPVAALIRRRGRRRKDADAVPDVVTEEEAP